MLVRADVIRRNVHKNTVVEQNAACAVQHKPLTRDLHDHSFAARIRHFPETLLNLIGLRCRVLGRDVLLADGDTVGADESGRNTARLKQRAYHVGGCRLALGARHADGEEFPRRETEVCRRERRQGRPRIVRAVHGKPLRQRFDFAVNDYRRNALARKLGKQLVRVKIGALHADKQTARTDFPRIIHQCTEFHAHIALQELSLELRHRKFQ